VLLDRAEGTYLWVSLVYEELRNTSIVTLDSTLKVYPKGLGAVYARILRHIPKEGQEIATQVLRKVVVAFRPLTVGIISRVQGAGSCSCDMLGIVTSKEQEQESGVKLSKYNCKATRHQSRAMITFHAVRYVKQS
jgi:hypothetical protein